MSQPVRRRPKVHADQAARPLAGLQRQLTQAVAAGAVLLPPPEPQPATGRTLGAASRRLIEAAVTIAAEPALLPTAYQHSVLCQTCLPYRRPAAGILTWERSNGFVHLSLTAGRAFHPSGHWVQMGLPFGPKPRQILAYLTTQAILQQQPLIDIERSLASFIRLMDYDNKGQTFRVVKEQIAMLAAADFRMGLARDSIAETHKGTFVSAFNLWCEKDDKQRVLWPRTVQLGAAYFESALDFAVPLDQRAIAALGHSAMALDVYTWAAQRLHRVGTSRPDAVSWAALKHQFGQGFTRIRKFRETFLAALRAVKCVYPAMRLEVGAAGLELYHSPPPIPYAVGRPRRMLARADSSRT